MITHLRLKSGPAGHAPLTFLPSKLVVLIGPNQSGKSALLGELRRAADRGEASALEKRLILDSVDFKPLNSEQLNSFVKEFVRPSDRGHKAVYSTGEASVRAPEVTGAWH